MSRRKRGSPVHGWICLDKPLGLTSTAAVGAVRRLFDAQKAGHAGTLDPLATGMLPIALGEATKTVAFMMDAEKIYRFTICWGTTTASFDREGAVTGTSDARPSVDAVAAALPAFIGDIQQIPPAFSAIKVDGERAYDLARAGEPVELAARTVTVRALRVAAAPDVDHVELEMTCGKGTYVRGVVRDLAEALGACAHLSALRRTRVGGFDESRAVTVEKLEAMLYAERGREALLPVETALDGIPAHALTGEDAFRLKQGRPVVLLPRHVEALQAELNGSRTVATFTGGRLQALCELRAGRLEPTRVFHLDAEDAKTNHVDHA